jgi:hypothetical protein
MVNIQKANGVQLISGADASQKAIEFIRDIATSIKQKVGQMMNSSSFLAVLSDGSQARKTNSEKELILIRLVHSGHPMYMCADLENVNDCGDASALNVKQETSRPDSSAVQSQLYTDYHSS